MERNGSLHVLRLGADPGTGATRYAASYTPYDKGGGAIPKRVVHGDEDLLALLHTLRVDDALAREVLAKVLAHGRTTLPNVVLLDDDLRRHGLQEMGILDSVISYLSA